MNDESMTSFKLIRGPDGNLVAEPHQEEECFEEVPTYCPRCRSLLTVSRARIFCPTDREHFHLIV